MAVKEKGFVSFRTKLIYFGATLIAIIAIPTLYFEGQRPFDQLYDLIGRAQSFIAGMSPAMDSEELELMNHFAIDMAEKLYDPHAKPHPDNYFPEWSKSIAFELLVADGHLMPERELLKAFQERRLAFTSYDYDELENWFNFWQSQFDQRPGLLAIYRKYKQILTTSHQNALQAGFEVANVYIIVDSGSAKEGFFRNNVAFVLESHDWWRGSHPGRSMNLAATNRLYYRHTYDLDAGGKPGYYHNPVMDPDNYYLPRFDTNEWGTWFTSWMAAPAGSYQEHILYNTFNIDFDSKIVQVIMLRTGMVVGGLAVVLLLTLILVTNRISRRLNQPVEALMVGAQAVMDGKLDHVVPSYGTDELSRLVDTFNRMTQWVSETVNLKDTLAKFLSQELAEMAAKDGLALGGRRVRCSMLFSDFAGFSTIAQMMPAEQAVRILNMYFAELVPIIKKWGGFPDKYIGDAIVVLFGAPVYFDNHAERAVRCAIEMQQTLREINTQRIKENKVVFEMRVGINTGEVVVGAIGCDLKMEYTSIGENTNLAHRMESKCKIGHVLMSENTFKEIKDCSFVGVQIGRTPIKENVKGYQEPVSTFGIYTHATKITVKENAFHPAGFYEYERMVRKAKRPAGARPPQARQAAPGNRPPSA